MVNQNVDQDVNRSALISLLVLAILISTTRSAARWWKTRAIQPEDLFLHLALASFVSLCALYLAALPILYRSVAVAAGAQPPWPSMVADLRYLLDIFFAVQLLFWLTLWSVKFSLLWMFRRLTLGLPRYGLAWLVIAIFTGVVFVGCVVSEFTSCSSVHAWLTPGACALPSDAVRKAASLWYSLAVDLLTDILIMAIPVRLLWNLQISRLEKISAGIAFTVGILTMIFAIIRCVSLDSTATGTSNGGDFSATWLIFWAAIEGFVAILVGSLPAFAVFVRSHVLNNAASAQNSTYPSASPNTSYLNPSSLSFSSSQYHHRQHSTHLRDTHTENTDSHTSRSQKGGLRAESVPLDDVVVGATLGGYVRDKGVRGYGNGGGGADADVSQWRRGSGSEAGLRDNTSWLTSVSDEEVGFGVGLSPSVGPGGAKV